MLIPRYQLRLRLNAPGGHQVRTVSATSCRPKRLLLSLLSLSGLALGWTGCAIEVAGIDGQSTGTTQIETTQIETGHPTAPTTGDGLPATDGTSGAMPTSDDSDDTGDDPTTTEAATTGATGEPAAGQPMWLRSFGSEEDEFALAGAFAPDGGMVFAGQVGGSFLMDGIPVEVPENAHALLLAKLGPDGVTQWARTFENKPLLVLTRVQVLDDGDILMSGEWNGTLDLGEGPLDKPLESFLQIFVARFDATGVLKWSRSFGTQDQSLFSMSHDADGNILLCGTFQGEISFGGDPLIGPMDEREPFAVKLTGDGDRVWDRTYHVASNSVAGDGCVMEADGDGNLYILGRGFSGALDVDDVALVSEGNGDNPYLLRLDPDGTAMWGRNFATQSSIRADLLVVDDDGTSWIGGGSAAFGAPYGTIDIDGESHGCADRPCSFVAGFDADGQTQQALTLAGSESLDLTVLASDRAGGVILAGHFAGTAVLGGRPLDSDVPASFVARVDASGAPRWRTAVAATEVPGIAAADVSSTQRVGVFGFFHEQLTVDEMSVTAAGTEVFRDMFVLELASE